ncbi:MAG: calcium-binding protein, partial [Gammaproteobacteria bacterium]|nr:calcium-binding protein [Gammaproteobacteria bacterium]
LLDGGWGDDVLLGNEGNDTLRGRYGDDRLEGGSGHDTLIGGAGDDVLDGGLGNDWLAGGIGDDVLRGSGGSDKFVFSGLFGTDTIKDFTDDDLIDLSALNMSFDEVMENARQDGSEVRLELESGTIVLENFELADLDYTDFLF